MSEQAKVERVRTSITLLSSTLDKIDTALQEQRFPTIRNRSAFLEYAALRLLREPERQVTHP